MERDVVGYEGLYRVSDRGEVWSALNGWLALSRDKRGYPRIGLHRNGVRKMARVHVLVLEAFVGPRPDGLEGRHKNGDHTDNRLENLEWGTHSENMLDAVDHGTHADARKTHCKYDHEFTPENTRLYGGRRYCRKCKRRRDRDSRETARSAGRMSGRDQRVGAG